MVAVRTLVALAALLPSLALPAAAAAQGAGDEQYQDPFGDEQSQQEPAPTPEPAPPAPPPAAAPTPEPASPSQSQATPPPAAATPGAGGSGSAQLPYTGADAGLLALAGAVLLSAGLALRRRADDQR